MSQTDKQLVGRYLAGEEAAFEVIVDRYLKPLYNFAFQMVGDAHAAEDITQEVFVKVWKHISSFDHSKKFSTWIYAIAKNAAYDYLKKKKSIPFSAFENEDGNNVLDSLEDESILHSHTLLQKMDDAKSAQEFLDSLSPQLKTIFLLLHKEGFSLVEVADIMGTPTNTIKSKYRRALMSLRNLYSSKGVSNKSAPGAFPAS
jgi:RNA polymerase sigma-70 factor (ECF subfamily)